ncbi:uncharacterized protein LOC126998078 [Eriocheir sinensis]|uniref:uncharacterized protein LOC126998078 n=1 Tax=Eriocheir sinensis TaxID=95602 RepID=UPI0021C9DB9D|nr:uncharacterized protein LOC126998078 [Eriocheir sinensis]
MPRDMKVLYNSLYSPVSDGTAIVLHLQPDFTTFLGEAVTDFLTQEGSIFADRLAYRDAWCLLLHKGGGVLHEALVTSRPGHNYTKHDVSPLTTRVTVPRTPGERCKAERDGAQGDRNEERGRERGKWRGCHDAPHNMLFIEVPRGL